MQWVETCSNKCTQNLSYPIWDPSIVFPADHLMPHTCAVQTTLVRRKSVLEDLYASLPSLDYAVEQCHPRNMHVLTVLTCNVKQGVTWFTKSCRDHQGSPSHKLHRRLFCYGVKWPVRALKHEILRLPSVPRAFTELPPLAARSRLQHLAMLPLPFLQGTSKAQVTMLTLELRAQKSPPKFPVASGKLKQIANFKMVQSK